MSVQGCDVSVQSCDVSVQSCDASVPSLSCSCPSAGLHPAGCSEVPGKTDAALVRLEMDMEVQCAVCRDSMR